MTPSQKNKFLKALAQHGIITEAAATAKISRSAAYRHRNTDKNFAQEWQDAREIATDRLAKAALDRAIDGIEEVKYYQGEPIGTVRKYSDQLLMFLLRAYRPALFNPAYQQNTETNTTNHEQARQSLIKKMARLDQQNDP